MLEKLFHLQAHGTSVSKEIVCGMTTFLTMSYILFVNPAIVSESGMPFTGIFVATALAAAICSFIMGFVANVPFAMASGMGMNTFFAYTICISMGFHWKEGLALVFITGIIHVAIMLTGMRKRLVNAIPHHLRMAFGIGLGLFIGYVGLKNAGLLAFTTPPGEYSILAGGTIISTSAVVPSLVSRIGGHQIIALVGLTVMIMLLALERKTGESYGALPVGILAATFIGIPMNVTNILGAKLIDLTVVLEIKEVFFSFWGDPGLLSIISSPNKIMLSLLIVLILLVTNVIDSIGTILGIGQIQKAEVITSEDMEHFKRKGETAKLDTVLACNSLGGCVAAVLGTTSVTTFMESITGIVAGARTGLASVTVGVMFLICLPFGQFFSIIPAAAVAPALIVAGAFMVPLVARINWSSFEEAFPAFATILCIPLTYGFVHGIAAGVLAHIAIQCALGRWRSIHPMLYLIAGIFVLITFADYFY